MYLSNTQSKSNGLKKNRVGDKDLKLIDFEFYITKNSSVQKLHHKFVNKNVMSNNNHSTNNSGINSNNT